MAKRPTRDDVARLAGISVATVSYVINNGPQPVSEEPRARVLEAIEQLDHRPPAPCHCPQPQDGTHEYGGSVDPSSGNVR